MADKSTAIEEFNIEIRGLNTDGTEWVEWSPGLNGREEVEARALRLRNGTDKTRTPLVSVKLFSRTVTPWNEVVS